MAQSLYKPTSSKQNENQVTILTDDQNSIEPNIMGNESSSEYQYTKVPKRQLADEFDYDYEEEKKPDDFRTFAKDSNLQSAAVDKAPIFGNTNTLQ